MSGEHDFEPIRGLPSDLPPGETILWQGEPDWTLMARRVFRVDWVAAYFVALMAWRVVDSTANGQDLATALLAAAWVAPIGIVGLGLLMGLAYLNSRTTVYTLTNRRLVMRFGAALTKAINIPYKIIDSAAVSQKADGSGDVALQLVKPNKISIVLLWPHARPGFIAQPQPALRCLRDSTKAAAVLAECLRLTHEQSPATAPRVGDASTTSNGGNVGAEPALA
ncbi:MAG: photosynthetic complex putative assembly protein PuhB [Hyphomonadaceae bacterium]